MSNLVDELQRLANELGAPVRVEYHGGYVGEPVDILLAWHRPVIVADNLGMTIEMGEALDERNA